MPIVSLYINELAIISIYNYNIETTIIQVKDVSFCPTKQKIVCLPKSIPFEEYIAGHFDYNH